jgi:Ca2+-dependent lipid-binding protein
VHEAQLDFDVESVGTQDPYCEIKSHHQEFKTRIHENGGKNPQWQQIFTMLVKSIYDDIELTIKNDNVMGDVEIAKLTLKLTNLVVNGGFDDWFIIEKGGKPCGKFHLSSFWQPDNVTVAGSGYVPPMQSKNLPVAQDTGPIGVATK